MPGRKEPGAFCQEGIRNGAVCCAQQCGACTDGPDPDDDELEIECAARPGGPERCCPSVIRERGETCTATQRDGCVVQGANNATLQLCYWLQHEHGCDYAKWPACASGELNIERLKRKTGRMQRMVATHERTEKATGVLTCLKTSFVSSVLVTAMNVRKQNAHAAAWLFCGSDLDGMAQKFWAPPREAPVWPSTWHRVTAPAATCRLMSVSAQPRKATRRPAARGHARHG